MARTVAIYARVSTEHEAQISALENQIQYYDEELKKHPDWVLYDRYIDEGITGTSIKKRPNFMRMIEDAKKGCFNLIITREVSRFARNTVDALQQTRELKKIGVEVYFTEDRIWTFDDNDGELKLTLLSTLAQNESRKISQRVKAGQMITFKNGVFYGSGNILGYDKVGKEMHINKEQAKTVKLIFDMYLSGKGLSQIKYELEKREMKTSTGLKIWQCANISRILKNPFYCGTIVYRKQYVPDYLEQKHKVNHGEVEQVTVEGKHEPIISKEDFNKVQAILGTHKIHATNGKTGSPIKIIWTKKLLCSCGSSMQRRYYSKKKDGTISYCYECYNQIRTGSYTTRKNKGLSLEGICDTSILAEWKLKLATYFVFDKLKYQKDEIIELLNKLIDETITLEDQTEINNLETQEYENRLKNVKGKKARLLDTYLNELISQDEYKLKKENFENEIKNLEAKINHCKSKNINTSETIINRIDEIKKAIKSKIDYNKGTINEDLIDTFIDKIIVKNDVLEFHLNYLNNIINIDEGKECSESNNLGLLIAKYAITLDDVIEYERYDTSLRTVKFNKPFIVELYI